MRMSNRAFTVQIKNWTFYNKNTNIVDNIVFDKPMYVKPKPLHNCKNLLNRQIRNSFNIME